MTHFTEKLLAVLFTTIIILSALSVSAVAFDAAERADCFTTDNMEIVCIAHRGDWHSYPENSAEAVRTAVEFGVVSVDVKITSDGNAVLMADDTTDRMCVNASGETVTGNITDYTLEELKSMYLRSANGTAKNGKTDFHPASLEDAAEAAGNDAALMLNLKCADFQKVLTKVNELGILDKVVFRFSDKNKTILETVGNTEGVKYCGNYQGNIIFLVTGTVKSCTENNVKTIELGSKNGHGVLYDNFLMKRFDGRNKAMVSMVGGRCGKRPDNETGWDDLIARGYSIFETDYPQDLSEYIQKIDTAKAELDRYVKLYANTDTAPYTTDTEKAFSLSLSEAEALLEKSASLSQLDSARFNLQSAFDNLTVGAKKAVTLAFDFTAGRAAAVILCGGAILASQIFLYRRREKKN